MSKLKEMQDSCAVFAADLKTGNVEWSKDIHHENGFITKWNDNKIRFYIIYEIGTEGQPCYFKLESFFYRGYVLQSTTAKEAAYEALQLVKQEAQKLVDALSVEIQETESRQAEKEKDSWTFARKTLGDVKDSLVASIRKPEHLSDSVKTNHIRDIKTAIIAVDKMGLELKKYNALSEPKETIKFDGLDEYFNPKADNYSKDFLEWRGKYFYSKKEVKEWKSKQNNTSYSNKELEDRYKNAFLDSPFNAKQ